MCGDLWFEESGTRMFTRCGRLFRASSVASEDMVYAGALEGNPYIRHLSHSGESKETALVRDQGWNEPVSVSSQVLLYDSTTLAKTGFLDVPYFFNGGKRFSGLGRYVFHDAAGEKLYVIAQADAASGLLQDFAVATY
jgi:hypothetical protein